MYFCIRILVFCLLPLSSSADDKPPDKQHLLTRLANIMDDPTLWADVDAPAEEKVEEEDEDVDDLLESHSFFLRSIRRRSLNTDSPLLFVNPGVSLRLTERALRSLIEQMVGSVARQIRDRAIGQFSAIYHGLHLNVSQLVVRHFEQPYVSVKKWNGPGGVSSSWSLVEVAGGSTRLSGAYSVDYHTRRGGQLEAKLDEQQLTFRLRFADNGRLQLADCAYTMGALQLDLSPSLPSQLVALVTRHISHIPRHSVCASLEKYVHLLSDRLDRLVHFEKVKLSTQIVNPARIDDDANLEIDFEGDVQKGGVDELRSSPRSDSFAPDSLQILPTDSWRQVWIYISEATLNSYFTSLGIHDKLAALMAQSLKTVNEDVRMQEIARSHMVIDSSGVVLRGGQWRIYSSSGDSLLDVTLQSTAHHLTLSPGCRSLEGRFTNTSITVVEAAASSRSESTTLTSDSLRHWTDQLEATISRTLLPLPLYLSSSSSLISFRRQRLVTRAATLVLAADLELLDDARLPTIDNFLTSAPVASRHHQHRNQASESF